MKDKYVKQNYINEADYEIDFKAMVHSPENQHDTVKCKK